MSSSKKKLIQMLYDDIPKKNIVGKHECTECNYKWEEKFPSMSIICPECESVYVKLTNKLELFGKKDILSE